MPHKVQPDDKLDCADTLALFIAAEQRKGPKSKYKSYLDTLPTSFNYQLVNWPDKYDVFLTDQILIEKRLVKNNNDYAYASVNNTYNYMNPGNAITKNELVHARQGLTFSVFDMTLVRYCLEMTAV